MEICPVPDKRAVKIGARQWPQWSDSPDRSRPGFYHPPGGGTSARPNLLNDIY
jgi:hypothetical protein